MPCGTTFRMQGPATLRSFYRFRLCSHPPARIVTEPCSSQVAWSRSMSWCRALRMVPHVMRRVVSSGVPCPVSIRGILAFARAELTMLAGALPSP